MCAIVQLCASELAGLIISAFKIDMRFVICERCVAYHEALVAGRQSPNHYLPSHLVMSPPSNSHILKPISLSRIRFRDTFRLQGATNAFTF